MADIGAEGREEEKQAETDRVGFVCVGWPGPTGTRFGCPGPARSVGVLRWVFGSLLVWSASASWGSGRRFCDRMVVMVVREGFVPIWSVWTRVCSCDLWAQPTPCGWRVLFLLFSFFLLEKKSFISIYYRVRAIQIVSQFSKITVVYERLEKKKPLQKFP